MLDEAREKSRHGGKKTAGVGGIKFEAEATGWLQAHAVPLTVGGERGAWWVIFLNKV